MANDAVRKNKAIVEATRWIKLEREGKIPPRLANYLFIFPVLLAYNYFAWNESFIESLSRSTFLIIFLFIAEYIFYKYRTRKEK